ncbi:MAG: PIG-L family deacetylase [Pelatocladus maniniholoensis HA4357-MV3]|jgi:LmbE family N-acetylglucosaminyl deacetylase|uniref:PIG-L family deacetylase n=1 Tax=Pelatocladus maniniholoensis HA4357-MV3 TaxID=1117104 RepID=A0A9E3LU34_9NOST|nr:PIG-L family deacetylase [Pelatocladus maniniholoensis HA4357-MV3]
MNHKILIIAPHPDDEILGVGGTIARFAAEKNEVYVVIMTQGYPPDFSEEMNQIDRQEALAAHQILGVKETIFLSFPAARLDNVPHRDMNEQLLKLIQRIQPDMLFVPFIGDLHMDHQRVFLSSLVAARPNNPYAPKSIYAYETLSETNWNAPYITANFVPNVFVNISAFLETKLEAMRLYASQIKPFPNERSEESLRALATLRGSTVNLFAAEAFYLIRQIY